MARKIEIVVGVDATAAEKGFRSLSTSAKGLASDVNIVGASFRTLLKSAVVLYAVEKAAEALHATIHAGTHEYSENAKIAAQTAAAIKSTGAVAGVTAAHIDDLGLSLSNLSGIDDEVVRSGENVLLSFVRIRNQAGKGNDIFDQATKAAVDFAARTGKDVPQAALILGKALDDPARRLTALTRVGINFTDKQRSLITHLQKTGNALAAQKLILQQVETRFGGAAKAAGQTVPGQLAILRDRFKDLAGEIVGTVAPAFSKALSAATGFVTKLSEKRGVKAKFDFVLTTGENAGRNIAVALRKEFDAIDWNAVIAGARHEASVAGKRIVDALAAVDYRAVGRKIGDKIVVALDDLRAAFQRVDWGRVGTALASGFDRAVAALAAALASVDWKAVAVAVLKFLAAAFKASNQLLNAIGRQLAHDLGLAIIAGLNEIGKLAEQAALSVALRIVKALDFTVHGHHIIPGVDKLVKHIQAQLDALTASADAASTAVAQIGSKPAAGINRSAAVPARATARGFSRVTADTNLGLGTSTTATNKGVTATQRNTWFDNAIGRSLGRVQDITTVKGQIAALQGIGAQIQGRINATKDVTRRLNLEDKLRDVFRQIKGLRADLVQQFSDALQLNLEKAQATAGMGDDLGALKKINANIEQQIKETGSTVDLQRQLFQNQQAIVEARRQQRSQRQFRALGFSLMGEDITPGAANLKKQLGTLADRIAQSPVPLSSKLKSQFASVGKVLAGQFGAVTVDVRSKIQDLFATIRQELAKGGNAPLTKTTALSSANILRGLGLDPAFERTIRARLSHFNSAGIALAGSGSGSGINGAQTTVVVHSPDVYLDGAKISKNTSRRQARSRKLNPSQRNGPNQGLVIS